jgi:fructokinase
VAAGQPAVRLPVLVVGEALVDVVDRGYVDAEPLAGVTQGGSIGEAGEGATAPAAAGSPGLASSRQRQIDRHPGGSPANVALGLARLGHDVRFATRLGRDEDGVLVRRHLEADGVRLTEGSIDDGPTSTATATLDATGAATYVFDLHWDIPEVDLTGVAHLHTGSIAATLQPGAARVYEAFTAAEVVGATRSYDPNLRPRIMGSPEEERPGVERLVAASDVVKASDEDLAWLYPGEAADDVVRRWAGLGPALVVVTRGEQGATATRSSSPDELLAVAPRPVTVVDTVGAGDAFMSGLLSGLLDAGLLGSREARQALRNAEPEQVHEALSRAVWTSSITCGRAGAQPPTRDELNTATSHHRLP